MSDYRQTEFRKWRWTAVLTALALAVLLLAPLGCSNKPKTVESPNEIVIVTSFYPVYIMTMNIAAGIPGVRVVNLTPAAAGCLHDYQLTPDDLKRLETARFLVINGAGMESFLDRVSQRKGLTVIEASKQIPLKKTISGEPNPHVWLSVPNAMRQVTNIGEQLAAADPAHAAAYRANMKRYLEKLASLDERMRSALKPAAGARIVTFHEAFPYFADEYGLTVAAVVEREPGAEPSAGELARTVELIKSSGIKAIFAEPQYSARAAETIARESGIRVYQLDPVVTGPASLDAYIDIMKRNTETLTEALKP
ncbi:MAG: metal ABC transporter substrate-binding protein [Solirubrobacterales bacterium]